MLSFEERYNILREAVERFLSGDYPNPRQYRPKTCMHGMFYYESCEQCNDDFLAAALAASRGEEV